MLNHADKTEGEIRVQVLRAGVIESLYTGYVSLRVADEALSRFRSVLKGSLATIWVVDTLGMQGFDPSIARASGAWVELFKAQGGRSIIIVSRCSTMKMFISTMAFVTGVPMRVVSTREEMLSMILLRRAPRAAAV
jgi:hypothetical protein